MATLTKKRAATKAQRKKGKDFSKSYNQYKFFEGKQYTGMQVGRSHSWYYDRGEWKETKITPDLWEIRYSVIKRRKGKAPEGSGVPVGTGYHWFIVAHQDVHKLNANDYTTVLTGLKYKLAHKRATKNTWSATPKTQRKHLAEFLKQMIKQLSLEPVPIELEFKGNVYAGEALPLPEACHDGKCDQLEVTLNSDHVGNIYLTDKGWKMKNIRDQKLVDRIGEVIEEWYK
ncbi:MAG: hypothetical protein JNK79_08610 [Chitinophagaceae bacterium]|nr:hypothetical protein [Chitinophagaceae bacterium]